MKFKIKIFQIVCMLVELSGFLQWCHASCMHNDGYINNAEYPNSYGASTSCSEEYTMRDGQLLRLNKLKFNIEYKINGIWKCSGEIIINGRSFYSACNGTHGRTPSCMVYYLKIDEECAKIYSEQNSQCITEEFQGFGRSNDLKFQFKSSANWEAKGSPQVFRFQPDGVNCQDVTRLRRKQKPVTLQTTTVAATTTDSEQDKSSSGNYAYIAGVVIALILLILLIAGYIYYRRRTSHQPIQKPPTVIENEYAYIEPNTQGGATESGQVNEVYQEINSSTTREDRVNVLYGDSNHVPNSDSNHLRNGDSNHMPNGDSNLIPTRNGEVKVNVLYSSNG